MSEIVGPDKTGHMSHLSCINFHLLILSFDPVVLHAFCSLLNFFKIHYLEYLYQYHQTVSNSLYPGQVRGFGPELA